MPKAKEKKSNPKKQDKNKKGKSSAKKEHPFQTFITFKEFAKSSWGEFKKIQWPTPRQAMGESLVVLFVVFLIVMIVMFYDWISNLLLGLILVSS